MSWWILPTEAVTAFAALFGAALGAFLTRLVQSQPRSPGTKA